MKVKDAMSSPVYVIAPEESLSYARNLMLKYRVSRLVVVDGEIPVGIITKSDFAWELEQDMPAWRRRSPDRVPVKLVMSEHLITTYPEASLREVAELMFENDISGLPVIEDGLVGIITKLDMVRHFSTTKSRIKVGDMMSDFVVTVHRHHSINHVIEQMDENKVHRVIVMEDGDMPVGIITESNLAFTEFSDQKGGLPEKDIKMVRKDTHAGRKRFRAIRKTPLVAEDVMSAPLITVRKEDLAVHAAKVLVDKGIDGAPVIDDGLVGIITKTDIVRAISGGILD